PYLPPRLPELALLFRRKDIHGPSSTPTNKCCGHPVRNLWIVLSMAREPYATGIFLFKVADPLVGVPLDFHFRLLAKHRLYDFDECHPVTELAGRVCGQELGNAIALEKGVSVTG